jgi:hypothetical protein
MSVQWIATLSLALEIPFDSKEEDLWSKLLEKHKKFADIVIAALLTIDIVRLPFINYSFIKWFVNSNKTKIPNQETIFSLIQLDFQNHLRQRVNMEYSSLKEEDKQRFVENINKFIDKLQNLSSKNRQIKFLNSILEFSTEMKMRIKELDEYNFGESDEN